MFMDVSSLNSCFKRLRRNGQEGAIFKRLRFFDYINVVLHVIFCVKPLPPLCSDTIFDNDELQDIHLVQNFEMGVNICD